MKLIRNKRKKVYDILLLCIVMISFVHESSASSKTIVPFTRATKQKLPKKKKTTFKERLTEKRMLMGQKKKPTFKERLAEKRMLMEQGKEKFRLEQETQSSYESRTHEGKKILGNAKFMIFYILVMATLYTAANDVIEQFTDALFQEKTFEALYDAPEFEKYKRETLAIVENLLATSDILQRYGTSLTAEEITRRYYQSLFQQGITDNEEIVLYLSPSLYQSYRSLEDMGFALGVGAGTLFNIVSAVGFINLCVGIPVLGVMLYSLFKYKYGARQGSTTSWQEVLLSTYNTFEQNFSIYDEFTDKDKEFIVDFVADHNELDADTVIDVILGAIRGFETVYSVYSRDSVQKYLTDFSIITNELNFDPTVTPPLLENMRNILRFKDGMLAKEFQGLSEEQRSFLQYSFPLPQDMRKLQKKALDTFLSQILRLSTKQQID